VRAQAILESGPVISTQVVNETIAALTSKFRLTQPDGYELANALMDVCEVVPVNQRTVREAMALALRYQLSHCIGVIVAAALNTGCDVMSSAGIPHGQTIDDRLTIVNPFIP